MLCIDVKSQVKEISESQFVGIYQCHLISSATKAFTVKYVWLNHFCIMK